MSEEVEKIVELMRQIERVLYEDTNAADHPCCGWGPLWGEIKATLAAYDAAKK
jgi:hypothetical protein